MNNAWNFKGKFGDTRVKGGSKSVIGYFVRFYYPNVEEVGSILEAVVRLFVRAFLHSKSSSNGFEMSYMDSSWKNS